MYMVERERERERDVAVSSSEDITFTGAYIPRSVERVSLAAGISAYVCHESKSLK